MSPRQFAARLVCFVLTTTALAQTPAADAPPVDAAAILKEVQAITTKQASDRSQRFNAAIAALNAAARSDSAAIKMFMEAVEQTQFQSASGDNRRFRDWKERNKELATDEAFGAAARLHLRYLALSLERASDPKTLPSLPALQDYLIALLAGFREYGPEFGASDSTRILLAVPITNSPVAQAKMLRPELEKLRNWEMSAGNVSGILEQNLRANLRRQKDPRLIDTWNVEIQFMRDLHGKDRSDLKAANLEQIEIPRLLWAQANDYKLINQKNRAITEMAKLIRSYQAHPDLPKWTEEITALLSVDEKAGESGSEAR